MPCVWLNVPEKVNVVVGPVVLATVRRARPVDEPRFDGSSHVTVSWRAVLTSPRMFLQLPYMPPNEAVMCAGAALGPVPVKPVAPYVPDSPWFCSHCRPGLTFTDPVVPLQDAFTDAPALSASPISATLPSNAAAMKRRENLSIGLSDP